MRARFAGTPSKGKKERRALTKRESQIVYWTICNVACETWLKVVTDFAFAA